MTDFRKVSLGDAVIPSGQCVTSFGFITWMGLCVALIFWLIRVFKVVCHIFQFWDIKCFFNTALKISDVSVLITNLKNTLRYFKNEFYLNSSWLH